MMTTDIRKPRKNPPRVAAMTIRLRQDERERFQRCANQLGVTMSSWMRMTLLEAVRKHDTKYG